MNPIYIIFQLTDSKGQFIPSVSLCVKHVRWFGMSDNHMLWDIIHIDGERERIAIECENCDGFNFEGNETRIVNIDIVSWWHSEITKEEFHERFGRGRFLNSNNHFVKDNDK